MRVVAALKLKEIFGDLKNHLIDIGSYIYNCSENQKTFKEFGFPNHP